MIRAIFWLIFYHTINKNEHIARTAVLRLPPKINGPSAPCVSVSEDALTRKRWDSWPLLFEFNVSASAYANMTLCGYFHLSRRIWWSSLSRLTWSGRQVIADQRIYRTRLIFLQWKQSIIMHWDKYPKENALLENFFCLSMDSRFTSYREVLIAFATSHSFDCHL